MSTLRRSFLALGLLFSTGFCALMAQQVGSLKGIVVDKENNETVIGASVYLAGTVKGSLTDLDGSFVIDNVPVGDIRLLCSYVGYRTDTLVVKVTEGAASEANFSLVSSDFVSAEVVITGVKEKSGVTGVLGIQQKSPSLVTGLSRDDIRKSPDRSTGDALKRVSGTSIQDNKFVVVRGLNDRYNVAMINGYLLPSTETDRRAFSFDLFPAALLDNLLIYKSPLPDLPGEFAGGVVVMNTREIPSDNFLQVGFGAGYNTQSTMKPYLAGNSGGLDWLGVDDGTRALPAGIEPTAKKFNQAASGAERYEQSKIFANDWASVEGESMPAAANFQMTGARHFKLGGEQNLGVVGAVTYNRTPRMISTEVRNKYIRNEVGEQIIIDTIDTYADKNYRTQTNLGVLLNFAYELDAKNRIMFNNVVNQNSENSFIERAGRNISVGNEETSTSRMFTATRMLSNQLRGEHAFTGGRVNWSVFSNRINIEMPSLRNLTYYRPLGEATSPFYAQIFAAPFITSGGRLYSSQNENNTGFNTDASFNYSALGFDKNTLKVGAFATNTSRDFSARWFGYIAQGFPEEALRADEGAIFAPENISSNGFYVKEGTSNADSYTATSMLPGAFAMIDQKLTEKLRLTGGLRYEMFNQSLSTFDYGDSPVEIDTTYHDILPSAILAYSFNDKSKLRASYGRTVSRPTFRELSPFSLYNFDLNLAVFGNPNLSRASIHNVDLRYEIFPNAAQMFAIGVFYKSFTNPIEQVFYTSGAGSYAIGYQNAAQANNYGAELEFRLKPVTPITIFGNLAYVRSQISLDSTSQGNRLERELQGQSPYLINLGINYQLYDKGWDATILFNQIGRRIAQVGTLNFLDVYEAPRPILDASITKTMLKKKLELKLTASDLLNRALVFYQDQDGNGRYDASTTDSVFQRFRFGTTYSASLSYKF